MSGRENLEWGLEVVAESRGARAPGEGCRAGELAEKPSPGRPRGHKHQSCSELPECSFLGADSAVRTAGVQTIRYSSARPPEATRGRLSRRRPRLGAAGGRAVCLGGVTVGRSPEPPQTSAWTFGPGAEGAPVEKRIRERLSSRARTAELPSGRALPPSRRPRPASNSNAAECPCELLAQAHPPSSTFAPHLL